jgi:hypothetical protein
MSKYRAPDRYLLWPYFGSEDIWQDAHDALDYAAEPFTPAVRARPGGEAGRRPRGRSRQSPPPSAEG